MKLPCIKKGVRDDRARIRVIDGRDVCISIN